VKRKNVAAILSVQLLIGTNAYEPSFGGGGLVISVVDKDNNGVQSEIFEFSGQRDVSELKIGTTDPHGLLSDNNYRCHNRNLVVKPVDRTYFDSPQQPCKSPEKLLVISRLTPDGRVSFGGFLRSFTNRSGDISQLAYKATINTREFTDVDEAIAMYKLALGTKTSNSKCAFDYKVDVNKSKFVMQQDKWEQVKESSEPAGGIVTLTTYRENLEHNGRLAAKRKCHSEDGHRVSFGNKISM
jgi:hypothetical protein